MAIAFELNAEERNDLGKGASRRLRRQEKVLGILYGGGKTPTPITLEERQVRKACEQESFYSQILNLIIGDKKHKVVLRDMQRHPHRKQVLHVDFLRVKDTDKLTMNIPLHFINTEEAPGVKEGGVVDRQMNEIEVHCQASKLPEYIEVDLANLQLEEAIHLSDLKLPEGVELAITTHGELDKEHDVSVIGIHKPRAMVEEEPEEAVESEEETAENEGSENDTENDDKKEESKK